MLKFPDRDSGRLFLEVSLYRVYRVYGGFKRVFY
jgi:hypothetical protein